MISYIIRRLLLAIPVLLGILFVTFALARMLPGDPCRAVLGEHATDQICDAFIERHGLDKPIPTQFAVYLGEIAHGDFGDSLRFQRPVTELLSERLPVTVELSLNALILAVAIGIPLGIISAYWRNSALDVGTMLLANMGVSMPVFWLGLMLAYTFAVLLKDTPFWLPPSGRMTSGMSLSPLYEVWNLSVVEGEGWHSVLAFLSNINTFNALVTGRWPELWDAIKHLILPAIALGTIPMAIIARMTRSSLLEVLGLDYVRTARAKGLREYAVVLRHALRNAMLPVVTVIGLQLGTLLGGAVLTETIFGLTGVGKTLFDSITSRDYVVVQVFTLVIAIGFVMVNLIVDLSYAFLDPRVRLD
ncbi:MAG: ABC transporter permease [Chloroflexota bacterium]|nr:ABC transporter permease [Chloroflexota bacterium]